MAGAVRAMTINAKLRTNENTLSDVLWDNEEHVMNETLFVRIEKNCRLEEWIVSSELLVKVKGIVFSGESRMICCPVPQSEIRVDLSMCPNHWKSFT